MGLFGGKIGKVLGGEIGGRIGGKSGRAIGSVLGEGAGTLAPGFKNGGRVKRTGKAVVHKGEYVLPKGVKPTAAQRKAVAAKKKGGKK